MNRRVIKKKKRLSGASQHVEQYSNYGSIHASAVRFKGRVYGNPYKTNQTSKIISAIDKLYNQESEEIERFARIYGKK